MVCVCVFSESTIPVRVREHESGFVSPVGFAAPSCLRVFDLVKGLKFWTVPVHSGMWKVFVCFVSFGKRL